MTILGVKKEMTQVFSEDGKAIAVTIIDIADNYLVGRRTTEKDGYTAAVVGKAKKTKANQADTAKYKELGFVPRYIIEERDAEVADETLNKEVEIGDLENKKVKLTGTSKGKGFQGVVKRWGFAGGPKTHGQSDRHRAPGSIGSGTTPGRVYKGKKMAGRMGGERKTIKSTKIVKHIKEDNLIAVNGPVPGSKGSLVVIKLLEE